MEHIIERYQNHTGNRIPEHDTKEEVYNEMQMMKKETQLLQLNLQRYNGEDLRSISLEELDNLEQQLEGSVNKVRARKTQLIKQQLDNLRRKELMLEEENGKLYNWIRERQSAMEYQQATLEVKEMQQQMDHHQFPFSGEGPSSNSFLQLASCSTQLPGSYLSEPSTCVPSIQYLSLQPGGFND